MKKTEIIKNAINRRVSIVCNDNYNYKGWLVIEIHQKNRYLVLPFNESNNANVICLCVSQIKHITYIFNGYRLW